MYILSKISDIMHGIFGAYKEGALPFFEPLLEHFVKLLVSKYLRQVEWFADTFLSCF